jgi:transposase-like protein
MSPNCPSKTCKPGTSVKFGVFRRASDNVRVQRYRCRCCCRTFSDASDDPCFRQKKRQLNGPVLSGLASSMSQNRLAKVLRTTRVTIVRKLEFLAEDCRRRTSAYQMTRPLAKEVQFDELETFEHTKCKPLSVALAVEKGVRRILGFRVSSMPSNGPLAEVSLRKYGPRKDGRKRGLKELLGEIRPLCSNTLNLMSDKCPRYERIVQIAFGSDPMRKVTYRQTKGGRGSSTGGGEIKKLKYDPLFSLNHTCAMLRANINRLFRKTWNTTKRAERLAMHLDIYVYYHNTELIT